MQFRKYTAVTATPVLVHGLAFAIAMSDLIVSGSGHQGEIRAAAGAADVKTVALMRATRAVASAVVILIMRQVTATKSNDYSDTDKISRRA